MKKYRIICIALVLSLLLSSSALALDNDYTYSQVWYSIVLKNSSFAYFDRDDVYVPLDFNFEGMTVDSNYVEMPGVVVGGLYDTQPYQYINYNYSRVRSISYSSPLGVTVKPNQTFNINAFLLSDSNDGRDWNLNGKIVIRLYLSDGSVVYWPTTNYYYGNSNLFNWAINSYGTPTGKDIEHSGYGTLAMTSWTNNTGSDVTVDLITYNFDFYTVYNELYSGRVFFGYLAKSNDVVNLPSYVEKNLQDIANNSKDANVKLDSLLNELESIRAELNSLASQIGGSSSTTNNYYQTITQSTPDDIIKQEELAQLVTEAKEELQEIQKTINSVSVPVASDLSSSTTSTQTQISIDESLANSDINNVFSKLFENEFLITMLLSCVSIATVGYVLFGKKG